MRCIGTLEFIDEFQQNCQRTQRNFVAAKKLQKCQRIKVSSPTSGGSRLDDLESDKENASPIVTPSRKRKRPASTIEESKILKPLSFPTNRSLTISINEADRVIADKCLTKSDQKKNPLASHNPACSPSTKGLNITHMPACSPSTKSTCDSDTKTELPEAKIPDDTLLRSPDTDPSTPRSRVFATALVTSKGSPNVTKTAPDSPIRKPVGLIVKLEKTERSESHDKSNEPDATSIERLKLPEAKRPKSARAESHQDECPIAGDEAGKRVEKSPESSASRATGEKSADSSPIVRDESASKSTRNGHVTPRSKRSVVKAEEMALRVSGEKSATSSMASKLSGKKSATSSTTSKVSGEKSATSSTASKVSGEKSATSSMAPKVFGEKSATSSTASKVSGEKSATSSKVFGEKSATSSTASKVSGEKSATSSTTPKVSGEKSATSSTASKVSSEKSATSSTAPKDSGKKSATSSTASKVSGEKSATSSTASKVSGEKSATSSTTPKVSGEKSATSSTASKVFGEKSATSSTASKDSNEKSATSSTASKVSTEKSATSSTASKDFNEKSATSSTASKVSGEKSATSSTASKVSTEKSATSSTASKLSTEKSATSSTASKLSTEKSGTSSTASKLSTEKSATSSAPKSVAKRTAAKLESAPTRPQRKLREPRSIAKKYAEEEDVEVDDDDDDEEEEEEKESRRKFGKISDLITIEQKEAIEKFYTLDMSVVDEEVVGEKIVFLDRRTYGCKICNASYPRQDKCQVHIWGHLGMRPYRCNACDFATVTVSNIRCHIRKSHLKIKPYACELCEKRYVTAFLLEEHMNTHTGSRPYRCNLCKFTSASRQVLSYHKSTHKTVKDITCHVCGKEFYSKGRMRAHMVIHNKDKAANMCKLCSIYLCNSEALERHHANVHSQDYVCNVCGKRCKSKKALGNHQNVHSAAKYKCTLCSNVYKSSHILKEHLLKHKGIRKYKCNVCGKDFAQQSHLAAHMAVHSEKRFLCPGCNRPFNRHDNMKMHTKRCEAFLANPELSSLLTIRRSRSKPAEDSRIGADLDKSPKIEISSDSQNFVPPNSQGEIKLLAVGGPNDEPVQIEELTMIVGNTIVIPCT